MAGAGLHLEVKVEDAELRARLAQLIRKCSHPAPALEEIGEVLWTSTRERFETESGPDGAKWAPNSAVTLARKLGVIMGKKSNVTKSGGLSARGRRAVGVQKVLTQSGILADTIARQLIDGGHGVEVGTNRVYGAVQQFGNPANRFYNTPGGAPAPIPPRPFLGISDEDRTRIIEILEDYLRP
ncbi:phage virion morphogenesis protein [Lamprocystis purpurea]|jgi:phage gpG-like protein|uniref:phage virion morphogenesis protein n=1 Tax=Lamprocystis purpurea TaxID=61598 RepID=UPI000382C52A|nr:phage virion morphogenesis protein [Lamprocystis purpurea]